MADFTGAARTANTILSSLNTSDHAVVWPITNAASGAVWPAANRAIYCPILVEETLTVTQIAVLPTAQSGNLDVGVYSETGGRLVSAGSTAVGVVNTVQAVNVTDTVLTPGVYYLALCVDNTTAAFYRCSAGVAGYYTSCGVQQQAVGAVTLPNPATFANPTSAYLPLVQATTMSATI